MDRIKQLEHLLNEKPDDEFIIFALAKEYHKVKDYTTAVEKFRHLRKLNPEYLALYYHLAQLHEDMGNVESALSTYEDGIQLAQKMNDPKTLEELKAAKSNLEYTESDD